MKKPIILAAALSLLAAMFTVAPIAAEDRVSAAWHVYSKGCEVDPIATLKWESDGPFYDPMYIHSIEHTGYRKTPPGCFGKVTVPDRDWAEGWTFKIKNKTGTRGDTIRIWLRGAAGQRCYQGTWHHPTKTLDEVETVCMTKTVTFQESTVVRLWFEAAGKQGKPREMIRELPYEGCKWTTPLIRSETGSMVIAKRIKPIKQVLKPIFIAEEEGYYGPADRSYQTAEWRRNDGVVCPGRRVTFGQ